MIARTLLAVVACVTLVGLASCERTAIPRGEATIDRVTLSDLKGIPAEFGTLIGVTEASQFPGWVRLWFQSTDGTIRTVGLALDDNRLGSSVRVIPRY